MPELTAEKRYTIREVAKIIGTDARTVLNYIKEGKLSCIQYSPRKIFILESQLNIFLEESLRE